MKLAEFLLLHGMTQADFAVRVSSTGATISRIVAGRVVPRRRLMQAIIDVTNGQVGVADLVSGVGRPTDFNYERSEEHEDLPRADAQERLRKDDVGVGDLGNQRQGRL